MINALESMRLVITRASLEMLRSFVKRNSHAMINVKVSMGLDIFVFLGQQSALIHQDRRSPLHGGQLDQDEYCCLQDVRLKIEGSES